MRNLWSDTCAEVFDSPPLVGNHTADLVIIGGGLTATTAALRAAGRGARVILLEAQTIGHGGSGRNVGLVNAGLWLPPDQVMQHLGQEAGIRLNNALAVGPDHVFNLIYQHDIQCEPVRNGTLHCAHSRTGFKDLENRFQQQALRKAPVHLIDIKGTAQAIGSAQFHGALKDDRAGTIQPLAYAKGVARAACSAGAILHEHSPVISMSHDKDWVVHTPQGRVRARALLLATNAYRHPIEGTGAAPMTPVHFFQLATHPLPKDLRSRILPNNEGCWDTGLVMTSFRKDQAGRFILGAMGLPDRLGIHKSWAKRALARLFPILSGQEFSYFWSGRIGMTSDHIPKIQRLGPNSLSVFGYSGRGISPGTVFGTACADALLDDTETPLPITPINSYSERFTKAKGVYFELGARAVHLSSRLI